MTLAPWRPILARALHRNRARAYCRYLQLATINASGRPSNRTVVFRGFVDTALQIVTDARSEKVQQIKAQPWAEACWYFTITREQFRISGKLTLVAQENHTTRIDAWQAMSASARQQFYWPHPGQAKADSNAFEPVEITTQEPPDNFTVLLLEADRVDHLMLKGTPQDRYIYEYTAGDEYTAGEWRVEAVNP